MRQVHENARISIMKTALDTDLNPTIPASLPPADLLRIIAEKDRVIAEHKALLEEREARLKEREALLAEHKRVFDLVKDFGTSESPKSTRSSTTHWCPGRTGHPAFRHNIASSLRLHTGLPYDWTPRSDAPLGSPLAPSARRVSRVASRLPGTTRLRFALHGGQRQKLLRLLEEQLRLARLRKFGSSSEKQPFQGELFDEAELEVSLEEVEQELAEAKAAAGAEPKKPRKRRKADGFDENLPRLQVHLSLDEAEKAGASRTFFSKVKEELDIVPAQARVIEYWQEKAVFDTEDVRRRMVFCHPVKF